MVPTCTIMFEAEYITQTIYFIRFTKVHCENRYTTDGNFYEKSFDWTIEILFKVY